MSHASIGRQVNRGGPVQFRLGSTEQLAYLSRTTEYRNTPLDAVVTFRPQVCAVLCIDQLRRDPDTVAVLANAVLPRTYRMAGALCASLGSGGEIGQQLYKEFGAGKLDGVDFQSVPTDESEGAGYGFWRLDAALATLE